MAISIVVCLVRAIFHWARNTMIADQNKSRTMVYVRICEIVLVVVIAVYLTVGDLFFSFSAGHCFAMVQYNMNTVYIVAKRKTKVNLKYGLRKESLRRKRYL